MKLSFANLQLYNAQTYIQHDYDDIYYRTAIWVVGLKLELSGSNLIVTWSNNRIDNAYPWSYLITSNAFSGTKTNTEGKLIIPIGTLKNVSISIKVLAQGWRSTISRYALKSEGIGFYIIGSTFKVD